MTELRRDLLEDRWVIVAPDRARRPRVHGLPALREDPPPATCPFCPGQEAQTRPEILVRRESDADDSPWRVRVVPNYYPMLEVEDEGEARSDGPYESRPGIGAHEVIIETARHGAELADLPVEEVAEVVRAWRDRMVDLYQDVRLAQVVVFKNRGAWAGATVEHAHSQLAALPVIAPRWQRRLDRMRRHYQQEGQSLVRDLVSRERQDGARVVRDDGGLLTFAPYASAHRYELMIAPDGGARCFAALEDDACAAFAAAVKDAVLRLRQGLGDPPYNLVLQVEPNPAADPGFEDPQDWFQWHAMLIPRLAPPAGFEWGTEIHVNSTSPEQAAQHLRDLALTV